MNNVSTQVNFFEANSNATASDDYMLLIDELKTRNRNLEELHYNTRFNSGILLQDEKNELMSLRNEFKTMLSIHQRLKKEKKEEKKNRSCCYCIIF